MVYFMGITWSKCITFSLCISENLKRLKVLFPSMEDSKLFAALETFSGDVNEVAEFLLQERGWYGLLLLILSACSSAYQ